MLNLKLGCFGDDFTGAGDAASFIKKGGLKTVLVNNVPEADYRLPQDTEAVVIALKIRTIPVQEAVAAALKAYAWLKAQGAAHIYYKYCSTFDSTDEGNIGPIIDALLEKYGLPYTILCPALPINGRRVQGGHIYVNDKPLDETPMRFHPLTPMTSSYIPTLMAKQGKHQCLLVSSQELQLPKPELQAKIAAAGKGGAPVYVVPDYTTEEDATAISRQFGDNTLLTGGSGALTALSRSYKEKATTAVEASRTTTRGKEGSALILAGSCSVATRGQIAYFKGQGGSTLLVKPEELFDDRVANPEQAVLDRLWQQLQQAHKGAVLVYSSADPKAVEAVQEKYGSMEVSARLERLMAALAAKAVAEGCEKLIVAGGETSGAVTEALQAKAYVIGTEIAPGVPIMEPLEQKGLQLALKSGNFGSEDFFVKALRLMEGLEK